jgi:hypothetical protein
MWVCLPTPQNSIAVYQLVGDAWGDRSFEEVVGVHKIATTFAYLEGTKIIALFSLTPVHSMTSAWISVWLCPEWRRKKQFLVYKLWNEAKDIIFKDLGFITITALTKDPTVVKLALRFGARRGDVVRNLYGHNRHGYLALWD